jgi:hypothetical protein
MTIQDLPRPWLLAALTGMSMTEIVRSDQADDPADRPPRPLPRAEKRRARLRVAERLRCSDDQATCV